MTETGDGRAPAHDLSMNETPFPPPALVRRLVAEDAAALNRYPEHTSATLVAALAGHLGVPADRVLVGPGSAAVCQHLVQALGPKRREVVHPALSFEAYPLIIMNGGARPVPVPMSGHRPDLPAMAAAVTRDTRCVLLCNPNNPTGAALHRAELELFLGRIPADVPVIVDEAYREFVTDPEVPDGVALQREHPNLVVLRTFSQACGLAGLRVGYAVAAPHVVAAARMVGMVFFPGTLGQRAAAVSLRPEVQAEVAARCGELAAARAALRGELLGAGLPVAPSEANFLWLPLAGHAEAFARRCRDAGILVRAYPGQGVRVTVGSPEANALLGAVARQAATEAAGAADGAVHGHHRAAAGPGGATADAAAAACRSWSCRR